MHAMVCWVGAAVFGVLPVLAPQRPRTVRVDRGPQAATLRDAIQSFEVASAGSRTGKSRWAVLPLETSDAKGDPVAASLFLEMTRDLRYVDGVLAADAAGALAAAQPGGNTGDVFQLAKALARTMDVQYVVVGQLKRDGGDYVCQLQLLDVAGKELKTPLTTRSRSPIDEWPILADQSLIQLLEKAGARPAAERLAEMKKPPAGSVASRLACDRGVLAFYQSLSANEADARSLRRFAEDQAQAALDADARCFDAYLLLANCQAYLDATSQFQQTLKKARTIFDPEQVDQLTALEFQGDYARFVEGDPATAVTHYEAMLEVCPQHPIALWALLETYLQGEAGATVSDEDLRQAGAYAAQLIAAHPGSPMTRYLTAAVAEPPGSR